MSIFILLAVLLSILYLQNGESKPEAPKPKPKPAPKPKPKPLKPVKPVKPKKKSPEKFKKKKGSPLKGGRKLPKNSIARKKDI